MMARAHWCMCNDRNKWGTHVAEGSSLVMLLARHIGQAIKQVQHPLTSLGYAFLVTCHAKPAAEYAGRGWKGKSPARTSTLDLHGHREVHSLRARDSLLAYNLHVSVIIAELDMSLYRPCVDSKTMLSGITHKASCTKYFLQLPSWAPWLLH